MRVTLYHTSDVVVANADTTHSRSTLDFGCGFYLTSIRQQAERYGIRFALRGKEVWLNEYELDIDETLWRVRRFKAYDEQWLDYVARCRKGWNDPEVDLIIGGVANDKVFETIDLYFAGKMSKDDALARLQYEKPNVQYCIRSKALIDTCLTYKNSIRL